MLFQNNGGQFECIKKIIIVKFFLIKNNIFEDFSIIRAPLSKKFSCIKCEKLSFKISKQKMTHNSFKLQKIIRKEKEKEKEI